ncbi:hypothetical protein F1559_000470 [Cyanidiococcus yangmingshanensis]|uniref:Sucrose phosphatase-like domain-containing protein n=1 Tax=Cyanidiococcus yangmingshanensis TaxID=2690220 RepID=A0A7J7IBL7_9RHOD|nr:hypothetical protein F1559_000470 [Cyanidiococcus yangmingshanensis]
MQTGQARRYELTLFSDIDGTLVHYRDQLDASVKVEPDLEDRGRVNLIYDTVPRIVVPCRVLPTLTSGCGYLSERTVALIDALRAHSVFVALLTGARSSTLYRRLSLLPQVDAIAWENGGRLVWRAESAYVEDRGWAHLLEQWTGPHPFYPSDESLVSSNATTKKAAGVPSSDTEPADASAIDAPLWRAATQLSTSGWVLDTRAYYTAFRVDVAASLQRGGMEWCRNAGESSDGARHDPLSEQTIHCAAKEIRAQVTPLGLQMALNLGKADVFPLCSGKRNVAEYILSTIGGCRKQTVALVDDDNDLELAKWCGAAYLPNISNPSVQAEIARHPEWTLSAHRGPLATEEALKALLEQVQAESGKASQADRSRES